MSFFVCDMTCGGRVELQCKDENDFKTYGITIKVSYRVEDTLQELRRQYQSGGEKVWPSCYSYYLYRYEQIYNHFL